MSFSAIPPSFVFIVVSGLKIAINMQVLT